jgi:hypothetical protein
MLKRDDFEYAIENTLVIVPPQKKLETFGETVLNYYLITEDMDKVNMVHIREGVIRAERPQILSPESVAKLVLEGFSEQGQKYADFVNQFSHQIKILQYGFQFKKDEIRNYEAHESRDLVADKIKAEMEKKDDPFAALLVGVEDGWEVCLLKFMMELISQSGEGNFQDLRKKGLI